METLSILIVFGLILFAARKGWNMGYTLLSATVILGVLSGMGVKSISEIFIYAIRNTATWELIAVITLINVLGYALKETGSLDKLVTSLGNVVKDLRLLLMGMPFMMGAFSVPGGALLSAPMVDVAGDRYGTMDATMKAAINVLFRHVTVFIFPFSIGLVLASKLANISIYDLILIQIPIAIVLALGGFFVCFRGYKINNRSMKIRPNTGKDYNEIFLHSLPVVLPIIIALVLQISFVIPLIIGVLVALLIGRIPFDKGRKIVFHEIKMDIFVLIIGIMFFKEMIIATRGVFDALTSLIELGIPLPLLMVLIPILVGLSTAVSSVVGVGISLTLFLPLIKSSLPHIMLVYVSSIVGYIGSPVHLCFALTIRYFNSSFSSVFRILFLPLMGAISMAIIIFALA